jgi:rare lipoprotein A
MGASSNKRFGSRGRSLYRSLLVSPSQLKISALARNRPAECMAEVDVTKWPWNHELKYATTRGTASYYGKDFHGRKTATGERFDRHGLTAAHRTLPLGTQATVTNMENGKKVDVEINDRGPYARGRTIDLAEGAAKKIDLEKEDGLAKVKIEPHKTVVVEKEGDTKIVCQNK